MTATNVIIKIDMEKSYDRVDWKFLIKVFEEIGFNEGVTNKV